DEDLAGLRERDDRGGRASALGVRDDGGLSTLEDGHHGVGGAQVDTDGSCHELMPPSGRAVESVSLKSASAVLTMQAGGLKLESDWLNLAQGVGIPVPSGLAQ